MWSQFNSLKRYGSVPRLGRGGGGSIPSRETNLRVASSKVEYRDVTPVKMDRYHRLPPILEGLFPVIGL